MTDVNKKNALLDWMDIQKNITQQHGLGEPIFNLTCYRILQTEAGNNMWKYVNLVTCINCALPYFSTTYFMQPQSQ